MRRWLREQALTLAFTLLLLGALVGQAVSGQAYYNEGAQDAGLPTLTLLEYVTSSQFTVDVAENWQSEYLQFLLYILLTVWLLQKGSPESKPLDKAGRESDEDQKVGSHADPSSPQWARAGGWRTALYSRSLGLVMGAIFLGRGAPSWWRVAAPTTPSSCRTSRNPWAGRATSRPRTSGTAPPAPATRRR